MRVPRCTSLCAVARALYAHACRVSGAVHIDLAYSMSRTRRRYQGTPRMPTDRGREGRDVGTRAASAAKYVERASSLTSSAVQVESYAQGLTSRFSALEHVDAQHRRAIDVQATRGGARRTGDRWPWHQICR